MEAHFEKSETLHLNLSLMTSIQIVRAKISKTNSKLIQLRNMTINNRSIVLMHRVGSYLGMASNMTSKTPKIVWHFLSVITIGAVVGCTKVAEVPNLVGLSPTVASAQIRQAGFLPGEVERAFSGRVNSGDVADQRPKAGERMPKGTKVTIIIEESVTVPNLIGKSYPSALSLLDETGLVATISMRAPRESFENEVLSQEPRAGSQVPRGSVISLKVAKPNPQPTPPTTVRRDNVTNGKFEGTHPTEWRGGDEVGASPGAQEHEPSAALTPDNGRASPESRLIIETPGYRVYPPASAEVPHGWPVTNRVATPTKP